GGEAQVLGGGRLGHEHDVLGPVTGGAEGFGQALDVGLGVGQVAQLVGMVLADAHEQGELIAAGPADGACAQGRGDDNQEHQSGPGRVTESKTRHGAPREPRQPVRTGSARKRYGSTRTDLTAIPPEMTKIGTGTRSTEQACGPGHEVPWTTRPGTVTFRPV